MVAWRAELPLSAELSVTCLNLFKLAGYLIPEVGMSDSYDSPWKEMLERYFPEFMAFFFPEAHREIDWSRGYESLDQELHQVVRDSAVGSRRADKLMKVWRRDGKEQVVFTHVEVQGDYDADFAERMYVYNGGSTTVTGARSSAWPCSATRVGAGVPRASATSSGAAGWR